jgi:hypothetical protein
MKKIGIKRYQKFDTLLSSILGSAIFTMAIKELGLPTSLKTNLMLGIARFTPLNAKPIYLGQRLISQGD